jgi:ribonuclease PH
MAAAARVSGVAVQAALASAGSRVPSPPDFGVPAPGERLYPHVREDDGAMRMDGRPADALRPVTIEIGVNRHAEGSCIVGFGHTRVLCTATIEERVPPFLRNTGKGWVTAEYAMLPRSTHSRSQREVVKGRQSGRTMEIQRLIGRSLRAVTLLDSMGERQIVVDCDVLQADGGTRTASITGAYVALHEALRKLVQKGDLPRLPLREPVAAVSCGLVQGQALLDLDYVEDSGAEADANFVLTPSGMIVEMQVTAEEAPLEPARVVQLQRLAERGVRQLVELQMAALAAAGFA